MTPLLEYTVTVTPRDSSGGTAVITVEIDSETPRITRIELVATPGASLTAQLRAVGLERMLSSFLPSVSAPEQAPAIASRPGAAEGTAAMKTRPSTVAKRRNSQRTPPSRPTVEAGQPKQVSHADSRAYRRMPDDLPEMFARDPRASALGEHYGVPVHTAIGWIRTARRRGVIPPARSRQA